MGSVIDTIKCPQCGGEAYYEVEYRVGEESVQCHDCGYGRRMFIKNIKDLKTQTESAAAPWLPQYEVEEIIGHGSYKYLLKQDIGFLCGSFTDPRGIQEFCDLIESLGDQVDHAEYSTFVDNQVSNKILVQGGPGRTWIN